MNYALWQEVEEFKTYTIGFFSENIINRQTAPQLWKTGFNTTGVPVNKDTHMVLAPPHYAYPYDPAVNWTTVLSESRSDVSGKTRT